MFALPSSVVIAPADIERRGIRRAAERALDEVLAESFPASDPPSWTSGVASASPARVDAGGAPPYEHLADQDPGAATSDRRVTVSYTGVGTRTLAQGLASFAGATGAAVVIPAAILLIGIPVALAVRGVAEAIVWLVTLLAR